MLFRSRIEKDPDARIASTVSLIFRKFAELGSVRQVYFWLDQQQIQLPIVRGPEESCETVWQPARYHAVHSVLKNPIYAGAYTYGRSKTTTRLEAGQKRVFRQKKNRREDWTVQPDPKSVDPFVPSRSDGQGTPWRAVSRFGDSSVFSLREVCLCHKDRRPGRVWPKTL